MLNIQPIFVIFQAYPPPTLSWPFRLINVGLSFPKFFYNIKKIYLESAPPRPDPGGTHGNYLCLLILLYSIIHNNKLKTADEIKGTDIEKERLVNGLADLLSEYLETNE